MQGLAIVFFLTVGLKSATAQSIELLWPNGAPGALGTNDVDKPAVYLYPATGAKANGAAVVICPGGGYSFWAAPNEGWPIAAWMNTLGVSAFVLKYRLGPTYKHPVEMHDAQRAMRWVRANAKRFNIDPKRVGIIGFSAGGHLAATVATHYDSGAPGAADTIDRYSCRPDFQILGYPVITMDLSFTHMGSRTALLGNTPSQFLVDLLSNEKQVNAKTPPGFLTHAKNDGLVPIKNSQAYYDSLVKFHVPAQFKIFNTGGHGFGLATGFGGAPTDTVLAGWAPLAAKWMDSLGFFKSATVAIQGYIAAKPKPTQLENEYGKANLLNRRAWGHNVPFGKSEGQAGRFNAAGRFTPNLVAIPMN
jgi:acetyl esterase/lipase